MPWSYLLGKFLLDQCSAEIRKVNLCLLVGGSGVAGGWVKLRNKMKVTLKQNERECRRIRKKLGNSFANPMVECLTSPLVGGQWLSLENEEFEEYKDRCVWGCGV